jgi:uncharacterized protein YjdB
VRVRNLIAAALLLSAITSCFSARRVTAPEASVAVGSVTVSPTSASVAVGGTVTLTAFPEDASGNVLKGHDPTWSSDNTAVARVSNTGVVSAIAPGKATIIAASDGMSGTSVITVSSVAVASVSLSPASASVAVGGTKQMTATPKDASGNTLTGRAVTWSSDNTAAATVSPSGLVKGIAAGTGNITATCEGQVGTSAITVIVVPVASVSVSPASASVAVGGNRQLTAVPKDASGNSLSGRTVTWSSDNSAAATVSSSGLVKGVAAGTAHVTATCEGQSGFSTITVTAPSPGSGDLSNCPRFPADNIWNRDISALPAQVNSAAWLSTVFTVAPVPTGQQIHVNLSSGNGHYINRTGSAWQSMSFGNCSDAGTYSGLYPYSPGVSVLQGGDPDHHCIMVDSTQCLLYELYDASSSAPTACDGVRWDLTSDALIPWGCSSADEAGLPIATGLFTYHELFELGNINHALRWQCYGADISSDTKSPLWPARHTSVNSGYTLKSSSLIPLGARIRLRADFQPTGAAASDPGFLALTAAMKKYGAFLGDRGSSTAALSGAMDSRWGSWPNNFMNWSSQWIPYLEVVDESGLMIDPNSAQSH